MALATLTARVDDFAKNKWKLSQEQLECLEKVTVSCAEKEREIILSISITD